MIAATALTAALLTLACTGGDNTPDAQPGEGQSATVTLLYTSNVHGEIEPCG